jgi:putative SOS response-associated peptidase YedK
LFAFAGLWAAWKDPNGDWLRSCTIVTTLPNQLVAEVHDRMPVILPRDAEDDWLDPDVPVEHALSLLEPYPSDEMRSVAVSSLVNNVKNDGPQVLAPA